MLLVTVQPNAAQGSSIPRPESALRFLPPLAPKTTLPALDPSVLDQVTVEPCELTSTGCAALRVLSNTSSGGEQVTVARSHYQTTWNTRLDPVVVNRTYRVVVRVGGLRLGSVDLVATSQQASPNNGTMFNPGDAVSIKFHIAANPVIRARVLHARSYPAYHIAQSLRSEFALPTGDIVEILYGDGRHGVTGNYTLVASTESTGDPVPCSSGTVPDQPFTAANLAQAISCSFGTTSGEAAALLDTRTGLTDSAILTGLAQTYAGWSVVDSATVLRTTLGTTDPTEAAATLLGANYSLAETANALKNVYGQSAAGFAGIAYDLLLPTGDILDTLESAYGLTAEDAAEILASGAASAFDCATGDPNVLAGYVDRTTFAAKLRDCGFSATSVARLFQSASAYTGTTPTIAAGSMLGGGFTPSETATALRTVFTQGLPATALLLQENGVTPAALGVALRDAFSVSLSGLASGLRSASFTPVTIVQAVAGPAFNATAAQAASALRQLGDVTPAETAAALDGVYQLGATGTGRAMTQGLYDPAVVAGSLRDVFSLTASQLAVVLHAIPYDATTTARSLAAVFGDNGKLDGPLVAAMRTAGFAVADVATGLRFSDPAYSPAESVTLLRAGGFSPEQAGAETGVAYGLDADAIAAAMKAAGYTPLEIARVLSITPYSLGAAGAADVLEGIGVGAVDLLRAFKLVYSLDGNRAATTALGGGYQAADVAAALRTVYSFALSQSVGALAAAGLLPVDSMPALRVAYPDTSDVGLVSAMRTGTTFRAPAVADGLLAVLTSGVRPATAHAVEFVLTMAQAGYGPTEIIDAASTSTWSSIITLPDLVAGLEEAGYSAQEIAPALASSYGVTAASFADLLASAGYDVTEVGRALSLPPFSLTAGQAAALLANEYPAGDGIVTVLKTVYQLPATEAVRVLKGDARYDASAAASGLRNVYGLSAAEATALLRGAGYPSEAVANALVSAYGLNGIGVAQALLAAGFTPADTARALDGSVLAATPGTIVNYLSRLGIGLDGVVVALRDGVPDLTVTQILDGLRLGAPAGLDHKAFVSAVTKAFSSLAASELADAITTALGVTGTQAILNLLAGAIDGVGLPAFTCTEILGAVDTAGLAPLNALGMLHVAGCSAQDAIVAVATVLDPGSLEVAKAAIGVFAYPRDAIADGLHRAYADLNIAALLNSAARGLVGNCGGYAPITTSSNVTTLALVLQRGGLTVDEIVPLLKTSCGFDASTIATVVGPATVLNHADSVAARPLAQHFPAADVVTALSSAYAATPARATDLLAGKYADAALVNGLVRALPLGADDVLALVRTNLRVANMGQAARLVAQATSASGPVVYTVDDVLRALDGSFGQLDPLNALTTLRFAGYNAATMIPAIVDADPNRATQDGALGVAAAALQVMALPMDGVNGVLAGLESAYGGINVSGLVRNAAGNLIQEKCATQAPTSNFGVAQVMSGLLTRGSVPGTGAVDLLAGPCAMSALEIGYVVSPVTGFYSIPAKYVRAATTAALGTTYAASTPTSGGTLTSTANGRLALASTDGVQLDTNDRLLVKNQADTKHNGIYTVTSLGSSTTKWVLTRAADNDESVEFSTLEPVSVAEGLDNLGTSWVVTSAVPTVGTSPVSYAAFTASGSMIGRYSQLDASTLVTELVANGMSVRGRDGIVGALRYAYNLTPSGAARALSDSFGLTPILQGLKDVYFANLAPVTQAIGLAEALKQVTGLLGVDPFALLRSLGDTLKDETGVGGPGAVLQCITSVGAIKGADYKLLDKDAPGNGVIATLDHGDLADLFPDPFSSGATGNLAEYGKCLADNDVGIPFPLFKVEVKYKKISFGGTSLSVPKGIFSSHVGWAPQAAGGALDAVGLLKLPALALEGNLQYRDTGNNAGCPASWDLPPENSCQQYTIDSDLSHTKSAKLALVNSTNGDFDMLVPALPGKLAIDAAYYSGVTLGCGSNRETQNEAIAATAIAAPVAIYQALPGSHEDTVASNDGDMFDLPSDKPTGVINKTLTLNGSGARCGRSTHYPTYLDYEVKVSEGKCVVSPLAVATSTTDCVSQLSAIANAASLTGIGQGVSTVTGTHNGGAFDVSKQALPGAPGAGAGILPGIDTPAGNFLTLMGMSGVTPGNGLMLARLLTTGYPV